MKASSPLRVSVMVAVLDAPAAVAWYMRALGAVVLWDFGSVVGLEIAGAPFFVGQPEQNGWESPAKVGTTTARIEVFCDDPDAFIARAVEAGANGNIDPIRNHTTPWGQHRQGGFVDPFGHRWMVGDHSPLMPYHGSA
jgi:PhnB protein